MKLAYKLSEMRSNERIKSIMNKTRGCQYSEDSEFLRIDVDLYQCSSTVTFLGVQIDLKTLDFYLSPVRGFKCIQCGNLQDLLSDYCKRPISFLKVLTALERFKCTLDTDVFMGLTSEDGSLISRVLHESDKEDVFEDPLQVKSVLRNIAYEIAGYTAFWRGIFSKAEDPLSKMQSTILADSWNGSRQIALVEIDGQMGRYWSTPARNIENRTSKSISLKEMRIASAAEVATALTDDDIISLDMKKILTRLGFDKLLSKQELSACCVSNPSMIEILAEDIDQAGESVFIDRRALSLVKKDVGSRQEYWDKDYYNKDYVIPLVELTRKFRKRSIVLGRLNNYIQGEVG